MVRSRREVEIICLLEVKGVVRFESWSFFSKEYCVIGQMDLEVSF